MRGLQQALELLVGQGTGGREVPHVATQGDRAIDGSALGLVEAMLRVRRGGRGRR